MCSIQKALQIPGASVSSIQYLYTIEVFPVNRYHCSNYIYGLVHHHFVMARNLYRCMQEWKLELLYICCNAWPTRHWTFNKELAALSSIEISLNYSSVFLYRYDFLLNCYVFVMYNMILLDHHRCCGAQVLHVVTWHLIMKLPVLRIIGLWCQGRGMLESFLPSVIQLKTYDI